MNVNPFAGKTAEPSRLVNVPRLITAYYTERAATDWIGGKANEFIKSGLNGVNRIPLAKALRASTTHRHDYLNTYISDLENVIDMDVIRDSKISIGGDLTMMKPKMVAPISQDIMRAFVVYILTKGEEFAVDHFECLSFIH